VQAEVFSCALHLEKDTRFPKEIDVLLAFAPLFRNARLKSGSGFLISGMSKRTEETVTEDLRFPLLISESLSIRNKTTQTFNDFGQALTFGVDLYSAFQLERLVQDVALDLRARNIARYIPEVRGWPNSKKPKSL
jgi:hypothetical protein